jgi:hypothetical protein
MRHLERHHGSEKEIIEFFKYPKGSKDRRHALALRIPQTNAVAAAVAILLY